MSLDRVISYLTSADRLAVNLQIGRNIGDAAPGPAVARPPGAPGTVSPSADIVPAGAAEADVIAQADTEAAFNAQTLLPASRSLLGLRPPLADPRGNAAQTPRPASSPATGTTGSSTTSTTSTSTSAANAAAIPAADGGTISVADAIRNATIGTDAPVSGTSETDSTDLPMSGQPLPGANGGEGESTGPLGAGMPDDGTPGPLFEAAGTPDTGPTHSDTPSTPAGLGADPAGQSTQGETVAAESPASTASPADAAAADTGTASTASTASSSTQSTTASSGAGRPGLDVAARDPIALAATLAGAVGGAAQTERAGIIASFVLNAAMIPGWPPPRPIEAARPDAALAVRQLQAGMDEAEATGYLAKLGVPASMLGRLAAWVEAFKRRARIWFGVMVLIGSSLTVLRSLKDDEDEPDEDELMAPDGRARLFLR